MALVSIVIPTLNEDLAEPLSVLGELLRTLVSHTFEILIVDDSKEEGRRRASAAVADLNQPGNVTVRLLEGSREGKGAAVRRGIATSRGDYVFTIDVDLPAPLESIEQFLRILESGKDVVIAERVLAREFSSPIRWILSRGLLVIQRTFVFHSGEFRDTQCGFKAFRGDLIRDIVTEQIIDGGMYDLEYLYVAAHRKARIEKVTIVPNAERRESRINVWKCLRKDPFDIVRVKAHGILGRYK